MPPFLLLGLALSFGLQLIFQFNSQNLMMFVVSATLFAIVSWAYSGVVIEISFTENNSVDLRSYQTVDRVEFGDIKTINMRTGNRGFVTLKSKQRWFFFLRHMEGVNRLVGLAISKKPKVEILRDRDFDGER